MPGQASSHQEADEDYGPTDFSYCLPGLPTTACSASCPLRLIRLHWYADKRVQRLRDVTLKEDTSRVQERLKPHVLAALNNVILALMDYLNVLYLAAQIRVFEAHPEHALLLVLCPSWLLRSPWGLREIQPVKSNGNDPTMSRR
jgi:hypothetical protein